MRTEQELQELLQKYSEGRCTAEEERLLNRWFSNIGSEQLSAGLSVADHQRMLQDFTNSPRFTEQEKQTPVRHIRTWKRIAVAAVVAGIVFFSWQAIYHRHRTEEAAAIAFVQVATGSAEVRQVVLPDSSVVWLNAHTTLAYHPDFAENRQIRLSGEAFFEVTHDKEHPFTVLTADSLQTTVLGTQFNIRNYSSLRETQITVISGRVQVAQPHKDRTLAILTHNQVIRYDRRKDSYIQTEENSMALSGWRIGEWSLNNQGVEELTLLLYNQYGITLVNNRQGLESLHLDANFSKQQNAKEIVSTFCLLAGCGYRWKNNTTVELY